MTTTPQANSIVVLDFETTGLSPDNGDRAIEIGAVRLQDGVITERFQALMQPGFRISGFIEEYTGISNAMLSDAPPCEQVMTDFAAFVGDAYMLAHNASFDKRFLDSEFNMIGRHYSGEFLCSLLTARRIYQNAPNHQLATLVRYANLPSEGSFHRALYDAEMTAKVWLALLAHINRRYGLADLSCADIKKLCKTPKKNIDVYLSKLAKVRGVNKG